MKDNVPVYLNTEFRQFSPKKTLGFTVKTLNQESKKTLSWSKRFMDVLRRIPEEYIFLVLDDFFVCDYIQWSYFEEIVKRMEQDPRIASFQMYELEFVMQIRRTIKLLKNLRQKLWEKKVGRHTLSRQSGENRCY